LDCLEKAQIFSHSSSSLVSTEVGALLLLSILRALPLLQTSPSPRTEMPDIAHHGGSNFKDLFQLYGSVIPRALPAALIGASIGVFVKWSSRQEGGFHWARHYTAGGVRNSARATAREQQHLRAAARLPSASAGPPLSAELTPRRHTLPMRVTLHRFPQVWYHPYSLHVLGMVLGFALVMRIQIAYQRFWEGATQCHQACSKWGDAIMQIFAFDEASKDAFEEPALEFRMLMLHYTSLMNACALIDIRRDDSDLDAPLTFNHEDPYLFRARDVPTDAPSSQPPPPQQLNGVGGGRSVDSSWATEQSLSDRAQLNMMAAAQAAQESTWCGPATREGTRKGKSSGRANTVPLQMLLQSRRNLQARYHTPEINSFEPLESKDKGARPLSFASTTAYGRSRQNTRQEASSPTLRGPRRGSLIGSLVEYATPPQLPRAPSAPLPPSLPPPNPTYRLTHPTPPPTLLTFARSLARPIGFLSQKVEEAYHGGAVWRGGGRHPAEAEAPDDGQEATSRRVE
jgi:hypothetical protein